jgi:hypothetical protein
MRCITGAVNMELLAYPCRTGSVSEIFEGFQSVILIAFREKSISLDPLHAVNFIASCRVMASIKEIPGPSAIPLSMPRKRFQASFFKSHCASLCKVNRLVLKARLKVLLAGWQHFVLLLTLEGWELRYCLVDYLESGLDLLFGNDKRRCQTDDVLVSGFGL